MGAMSSRHITAALFVLVCVVQTAVAYLNMQPGSLDGTDYDAARGLSDKQLGMLRWIAHMAKVPRSKRLPPSYILVVQAPDNASNSSDISWEGFNVDVGNQAGMDGVRYALAFLAYAVAGMTHEHAPAYREVACNIMLHMVWRGFSHVWVCRWPHQ